MGFRGLRAMPVENVMGKHDLSKLLLTVRHLLTASGYRTLLFRLMSEY